MKREGCDGNSCVLESSLTEFMEMMQTNMKNLWFFWLIGETYNFMTHLKSTASLKFKSEALLEDLRNLKISRKKKT